MNNIPAFPSNKEGIQDIYQAKGMLLLDYFAGQALNGMVHSYMQSSAPIEDCVRLAYKLADAMMKEREGKV